MSPKKRTNGTHVHHGAVPRAFKVPALRVNQDTHVLYLFTAKASVLFASLSINRRVSDKDEGYQRVLSPSRVEAISRFFSEHKAIPGALIASLDKATYDERRRELSIPPGRDVGWIIDGQHRLAGAAVAARTGADVDLPVVAFVGLPPKGQIEQFITINREAKNVPTSLYLDLLRHLPTKNAADAIRQRATDLATELRRLETSPFFERIAFASPPKRRADLFGELRTKNLSPYCEEWCSRDIYSARSTRHRARTTTTD